MNWTNKQSFQDTIFNFMEKVRKHKFYFIIGGVLLILVIMFLLLSSPNMKEKYIELVGSEVITIYAGDSYKELGYKAYDKDNNSYTSEVIVESNLDNNVPGTYEIQYKIGNKTVKRKVIVVEKPKEYYEFILTKINEEETIYIGINSEFVDPGYQVFNNNGEEITESVEVQIDGEVDTTTPGVYTLVYQFTDPNDEVMSIKRDVVVIDNKLNLELSTTNFTNSDVVIKIEAIDEYFDYILMPNGTQIEEKKHSYLVSTNGEYKFILYNKKGINIEKTMEVKNIDKEPPTGTCKAYISDDKTIVNLSADDNFGVAKYEILGNSYSQNEIVLNKKVDNVNVRIYDIANNTTDISCVSENKKITLYANNNNYTNEDIIIYISVDDSNFNYLKLPNGNIVNNTEHAYLVSTNGVYTFYAYDTNGGVMQESITINKIDKQLPTGTCQIKQNSTGIYIEINASDNVGISKYVYNNKTYTTNQISLTSVPSSASISIYDKANNVKNITCSNTASGTQTPTPSSPTIKNITKDGVIVTVTASKANSDIAGYYFSYNNVRPSKTTGGYVSTSNTTLDVVRLPGTTYVWVEDKNGNISSPKTITLTNDALLITKGTKYTKLEGTKLSTYLTNKGWSIEGLNNLIARSSRAAGLYTKEAAATSAVAFQTVIAQKYKIKIPYWWGGKSWSLGADSNWGVYKKKYSDKNKKYYYYYGLDCSGFTTWAYINAGYKIKSNVYPDFWGYKTNTFAEENGEIGDFITTPEGSSRHVKLIIGKTSSAFITAEAAGKGEGMIVNTHAYTNKKGFYIRKGERLMEVYSKIDASQYPSGF